MIRKIFWRCFLAGSLALALVLVTVSCVVALACSSPGFYSTALLDAFDEAEIDAATEEMETTVGALQLFLLAGPTNLEQVEKLPADQLARGMRGISEEGVPAVLDRLRRSADLADGTFAVSLTARQLNALLVKEMGASSKEIQQPRLALDGELVRLAATVVTPPVDLVISCDFKPVKSNGSDLTFELHAARLGRLPMPATYLLDLYEQANPRLPKGVQLNLDGDYPTITIDAKPDRASLLVDQLHVVEGELRLKLRRKKKAVVAAK